VGAAGVYGCVCVDCVTAGWGWVKCYDQIKADEAIKEYKNGYS
jgi:hypothetical protein